MKTKISILDYSLVDLMFAYWLKRKRQIMARERKEPPKWLSDELDRLLPLRNPNCSVFILDGSYGP